MHISKNSATQIVEEISKLVKQNINLMDETGHIIASRDKSRIGDFHYGAYKIISENLEEYYIDEDDLSKGIKKGINLPLELDGGIVYGIFTGNLKDVTEAAVSSSRDAVSLCISMAGVVAMWSERKSHL